VAAGRSYTEGIVVVIDSVLLALILLNLVEISYRMIGSFRIEPISQIY